MATIFPVALGERLPKGELPVGVMRGFVNTGVDTDGGYKQEAWSYWQVRARAISCCAALKSGGNYHGHCGLAFCKVEQCHASPAPWPIFTLSRLHAAAGVHR